MSAKTDEPKKMPQEHKAKCDLFKHLKEIGSPIDISLEQTVNYFCPPLDFMYYDTAPDSLEMINTGSTILIKGPWLKDRPCLFNGPLPDKYIFTQLHFHWGRKVTQGSEHTVDGEKYCMEMHVVHFKREYIYPEVAKTKKDGLLIIVYLLKFQFWDNPDLSKIVSRLGDLRKPNTSINLEPEPIDKLCRSFSKDFFLYRGTIDILNTTHTATWILPRHPLGVSEFQVKEFQHVLGPGNKPIRENIRELKQASKQDVHFINPSPAQFSTMHRF